MVTYVIIRQTLFYAGSRTWRKSWFCLRGEEFNNELLDALVHVSFDSAMRIWIVKICQTHVKYLSARKAAPVRTGNR